LLEFAEASHGASSRHLRRHRRSSLLVLSSVGGLVGDRAGVVTAARGRTIGLDALSGVVVGDALAGGVAAGAVVVLLLQGGALDVDGGQDAVEPARDLPGVLAEQEHHG